MLKKAIFFSIIIIVWAISVEAKNLYVDVSVGSDSVSYENNSSSSPWRTIGRAAWGSTNRNAPNPAQAAQAGDTIYVQAGTYVTEGTGTRYDPAYNPANTGTINAPITFQAEGRVVLEQSGEGPLIGALDKDYIIWSGFTIYEINALATSDTGPAVLWSTTGSVIEDCEIDGWDNGRLGSNHNAIRIEYSKDVVVRNNRLYNVLNFGSKHMNGAGIMAYFSDGAIIEHNEIYECGSGIFIKGGDNANFTVRYNYVYNTAHGILIQYTSQSGEHKIYQNLVRNNSYGISVRLNAYNVKVVNNTVVNNAHGIWLFHQQEPISNILVQNNIVFQGSGELINGGEFTVLNQLSIDRNSYFGSLRWSINYSAYSSLSAWRTALGGGCPGSDCNSITSDPLFVNLGADDYRLQAASPARTMGVDILNLAGGGTSATIPAGAYINVNESIGIIEEDWPPRKKSKSNTIGSPCCLGILLWSGRKS